MTVPAGIEVTQTVERTLFIRDLVVDLDADVPCEMLQWLKPCPLPARWRLLFEQTGFVLACDRCKQQAIDYGDVPFPDGESTDRLLWVGEL